MKQNEPGRDERGREKRKRKREKRGRERERERERREERERERRERRVKSRDRNEAKRTFDNGKNCDIETKRIQLGQNSPRSKT